MNKYLKREVISSFEHFSNGILNVILLSYVVAR